MFCLYLSKWWESMRSCYLSLFTINLVDSSGGPLILMIFDLHESYREEFAIFMVREENRLHRSHRAVALSTYSSRHTVAFYLPCCHRSAWSLQSFWSRAEKIMLECVCVPVLLPETVQIKPLFHHCALTAFSFTLCDVLTKWNCIFRRFYNHRRITIITV